MIIIIDNYDSFTYNLYQAFAQHAQVSVFRNDQISIDEIKSMNPSAIVLSPGPGKPEDAGICVELVKELHKQIPILGICLGHQAIAHAFGANVIQHQDIVHGKSDNVHHMGEAIFKSLACTFQAARYHSLTVDIASIPAELLITAIGSDRSVMGVRHHDHHCYGVQFHPESILTPQGDQIIKNFIEISNNHQEGKNYASSAQQAYAA